jgi:hypothetical protein
MTLNIEIISLVTKISSLNTRNNKYNIEKYKSSNPILILPIISLQNPNKS